jgi:prepilin-type N-terminal cleavage/methylation domain-containing protein
MRIATRTQRAVAGFTLLELVFTIVILGALAKFAVMKLVTPATMTLPTQAQSLADLIRRAQSLAVVRGQRMSVSVATSGANGRVAIACIASAPCNTDTSLTVSQGAVLGSGSTIYFNSLGQPVNSAGAALSSDATFTLSYETGSNNATYTVTVSALTGRVSVSP